MILGALLATLLLGRLLENLKAADQQPTGAKLDVSAIAALVTALEDEEDSDDAEPGGAFGRSQRPRTKGSLRRLGAPGRSLQ